MLTILLAAGGHHATDAAASAVAGVGLGLFGLVWVVLGSLIYFLPSIIAFARKRPNAAAIFVLNFFLGWSLIGWVVSLVWALTVDPVPQQIIVQTPAAFAGPPAVQLSSSEGSAS